MGRLTFMHLHMQAHVWFFIASFGYVTYDILYGIIALYCPVACAPFNASLVPWANFLSVLWATCYLVDSYLYFFAMLIHDRPIFRGAFLYAELGNVISSSVFLASQAVYYVPDFNAPTSFDAFAKAAYLQSALYCAGLTLWALNSLQYAYTYYVETYRMARQRPARLSYFRDIYFWGEVLNVVPSFGYMAVSIYGLALMPAKFNEAILADNVVTGTTASGFFSAFVYQNQQFQLILVLAFDLMFSADAALYFVTWWQEYNQRQKPTERGVELNEPLLNKKD